MIGRPGSTLWLLGHELRLALRRRGRGGWRPGRRLGLALSVGAFLLLSLAVGVPAGLVLTRIPFRPSALFEAMTALAMLAVFTLMLSQSLSAAVEALYERADLDLLFSSPIRPTRVLAIRFLGVATLIFWTFGFFLAGPLLVVAVMGHPEWLGGVVVLAALALAACGAGLLLSSALFRTLGPRRTRAISQVLSAIIGAAFFLAFQLPNLLGEARTPTLMQAIAAAAGRVTPGAPGLDWPLRAVLGDPLPLAAALAFGIGIFTAASLIVGPRFADDVAAASGAAPVSKVRPGRRMAFASGLFAVTVQKELRLLLRDPGLLSQVLLRVIYLLPLGFILLRESWHGRDLQLAGTAGALAVMAGQIGGSLAWITVSAEDAPDLIASAPASSRNLRNAKLAAAALPVTVLLTPVLLPLTVAAPTTGFAATLGCAVAVVAASLLNLWWQRPGDRRSFLKRQGSWMLSLGEIYFSLLTGAATVLAAGGFWAWALIPLAVITLSLLVVRRTDPRRARPRRARA